jgi:hypothetical protein
MSGLSSGTQPALTNRMHASRPAIPRKRARQAPPERYMSDQYAVGQFGPQHGLTPEQAWLADRLLAEKQRDRPLRGCYLALRMGGIVSAVKGGRIRNSRWGRLMLATRGGRMLARKAPDHLRRISERGVLARRFRADMRRRYGTQYG